MDYFAGIDVSLETANVCIVDGDGAVVLEQKVGAEPQGICRAPQCLWQTSEADRLRSRPDVIMAVQQVASGRLSGAVS